MNLQNLLLLLHQFLEYLVKEFQFLNVILEIEAATTVIKNIIF